MSRHRRRDAHRTTEDAPATFLTPETPPRAEPALPAGGRWSRIMFLGEDRSRRPFAHAMLARLAASHPPGELLIALWVAPARQAEWAWTRWLPHTRRPGPEQRPIALLDDADFRTRPSFEPGVRPDPTEPLVVVLLDGADLAAGDRLVTAGFRNTVVLDLDGMRRRPGRTTMRLDADTDGVRAIWLDQDRGERSARLAGADDAAELVAPRSAGPDAAGLRIAAALDAAGPEHPEAWPPPLTVPPTIDHLLPPLLPTPGRGLIAVVPTGDGAPMMPVGVLDRPFERAPDVLRVDLSAHLLISGPGGSGRSTLLTTLAVALALTHSPREAQVYCLDPDGSLGALSGLPHVGAVVDDAETGSALIAKLTALLDHRIRLFAEHDIDGMAGYRARRDEFPDEPYGDVYLLADGAVPDVHDADLVRLVADGPGYGIHLVVTAGLSTEPPAFLRAGTGLELRLDDLVVAGTPRPGRGMVGHSAFLTALPRIDGVESAEDLPDALAGLVKEVAEHWGGRPGAPGLHPLPAVVTATSLPEATGPLRAVIGVRDGDLAPVEHDFITAPHLLVVGAEGSGKTNLLNLIAQSITLSHRPLDARILVVDPQGGLVHAVPEEFLLGHAFSARVLGQLVEGTVRAIGERMTTRDSGDRTVRDWHGPRLFILVDDYERLRDGGRLKPLIDYLPRGHELGAHLVVACSSTDAATALSDPLLRGLHDAGAGALLLSCPLDEADVLDGLEPGELPPGRAFYRTGSGTALIQTALAD
ncbi:MAG TPA: type VII secretion protein EccCb [Actinoallomurus sp.]